MKKYLYFVIPIIILLMLVLAFIWLNPNKKAESSPSMNEVISEIPEVNNENMNVIEPETTSPEISENEASLEASETENVDEVIPKENTSKPTSSTTSITSSKTTSTSKKKTSTESTKKEEPKVTVKVEETKPSTTQDTQQAIPKQDATTSTDTESEEIKKEEPVVRCTNSNNHGMSVGNTGKWFSSKDEAVAYYKSQVKYWGDWWEGTSADDTEADATYRKNCPSGYEVWSCMYCSKWTINFYYR